MITIQFIYNDQIFFKILPLEMLDQIQIRQFFEDELKPKFNLEKDNNEYLLFSFQPQEINEQNLTFLHLGDYQLVSILEKDEYKEVFNYCENILPSLLCSASRTSEIGIDIAKQINVIREIYLKANSEENVAYMCSLLPNETFQKTGHELVIFLLDWFRGRYFSSDETPVIQCHYCDMPVKYSHLTKVTLSERTKGAIYTYIFKCRTCGASTRKPHFLNASEIDHQNFTTRNDCVFLFLSLLRAVNVESRIVVIPPKFYFIEFWSDSQNKFVHFDPFQCAYDCPLIYERAWNMTVSYAIAVDEFACTDVTPKYSVTGVKFVNSKVYSKIVKIKHLMFQTFVDDKKKKEINQKIQYDNESMAAPNPGISEFEKEKIRISIVN